MKRLILFAVPLFVGCGSSEPADTTPMAPDPAPAPSINSEDAGPVGLTADAAARPEMLMPKDPSEVVFFAFDSAELREEGKRELADELAWLEENPQRHIIIHGYTDDVGSPSYNLTLGNARADAVRTYFNQMGIDLVRLHVVSHGENGPELEDHVERRSLFVGSHPAGDPPATK